MRVFQARGLSAGEIALARLMFADAIAYGRVRIVQGPRLVPFGAMVPAGLTIVFGRWPAAVDFAEALVGEQGWFIHEMAHVAQAAAGKVLALSKVTAIGRKAYRYQLKGHDRFDDLNIEQQAEVARGLFLARLGAPAPEHAPRAALEAIWPYAGSSPS
jgi:hypothetical protein